MTPGAKTPRPDNLAPGTQVDRWRVVEHLGEGGQGAVYRVEDIHHPGDFYALKLSLYPHDARAEREAVLMMSRAAHPHVVGFHGCARWPHPHEGHLGFVMDWVPGLPLDAWAETGSTTFRQLAAVGATVARTLGELHERGVLHRDLKPEHIRIRAADGQPVLLDFGVGWYAGAPPLTTGPLPPATLYLLSPEAVRFLWTSPAHPGKHYACQPTDDLYALGVCLYRATTGHYPFSDWMERDALQVAILHARPPAPMLVNPRVPSALRDVIVRLLAKDPSQRYPSGAALHAALEAVARGREAAWDDSIFDWEEFPSGRGGDAPERCIILPPRPRLSFPSLPVSAPSQPPPAPGSPPPTPSPVERSRWTSWLRLAAGALLVMLSVIHRVHVASGTRIPDEEGTSGLGMDSTAAPSEQTPPPGREQKRAPCIQGLEVEFSGACWHRLWQRPPDCPHQTVAYQDKCLWPVPRPSSVPTSVDGGAPDSR